MSFARIVGTGSFLPSNVISNADLMSQLASKGIETSEDWIYSRSGIQSRRFADRQSQTSDLAATAASRALSAAQIEADAVDLIVVTTTTPDAIFRSTACLVQRKLGIRNGCAAFDIQAVCGGFIYALTVADALIRGTSVKTALVIGAETFSMSTSAGALTSTKLRTAIARSSTALWMASAISARALMPLTKPRVARMVA
ncbi:MAG: 3-oxoacyl-[acyl-carrier-protein] synthase [Caballeronia mineralivorans]|jgi:3-oxoacyl-[acyl-carrier-protein] synthase-3|nr:3-oxoacyl-[acyl-carrier-protein] synthase [Caballeronia mineralivorans]